MAEPYVSNLKSVVNSPEGYGGSGDAETQRGETRRCGPSCLVRGRPFAPSSPTPSFPRLLLEQARLVSASAGRGHAKMLVSQSGGSAASGGAVQEADLYKVGLVDLFNRVFFFAYRSRQGAETHRPEVGRAAWREKGEIDAAAA